MSKQTRHQSLRIGYIRFINHIILSEFCYNMHDIFMLAIAKFLYFYRWLKSKFYKSSQKYSNLSANHKKQTIWMMNLHDELNNVERMTT